MFIQDHSPVTRQTDVAFPSTKVKSGKQLYLTLAPTLMAGSEIRNVALLNLGGIPQVIAVKRWI